VGGEVFGVEGELSRGCPSPATGARRAAIEKAQDEPAALRDVKYRFLRGAMADGKGGQHSTGVRYWLIYTVFVRGVSPIQDPRDQSWETAAEFEDLLEDCAVWVAVCKPSGNLVSHGSIGKYISSIRAWYRRTYRRKLGLGAEGSRINDVLKGYAREVPQPPPMERHGCTPRDLILGLERVRASQMWRAATTFAVSVMARGCEIALDAGRGETFEPSEHMMATDVKFFYENGVRHARVHMRKRKDLRVLRGKQTYVIVPGGGAIFDAAEELWLWTELRRAMGIPDDAPLFCHDSGAMITVDQVRDLVKGIMEAVGRLPSLYGAHSLRIGGASAALAAGVPPQLIRLLGRWSSDVYQIYCRMSSQAAISAGQQLCSAEVDPLERQFHEEHLELLDEEVDEFRGMGMGGEGGEDVM
jgi:hypothetical protein